MTGPLEPFNVDFQQAALSWLMVVAVVSISAFLVCWAIASLRRWDVREGFLVTWTTATNLFRDLFNFSPRRFWAITLHCLIESWRKRVLLVFVVFAVLFLFAGWYLTTDPTRHVPVYVSFVMMTSMIITMVAMALVSAINLPTDIRLQTIHTVMTKPVRRLELVLGKIAGFTIVATLMLAVMGVASYIYLVRSVSMTLSSLEQQVAEAERVGNAKKAKERREAIEQIRNSWTARVPAYGSLVFRDEEGNFHETFKSVGEEWTYRSYIEGNTTEAAIWRFENLPVEQILEDGEINVELTFTVFRTFIGIVGRGVVCQLIFRNPKTGYEIPDYPFEIREYYSNRVTLRHDPADPQRDLKKLFEGSDGSLEIEARCLSPAQYLGMGPTDLYIRLGDASFLVNFIKGMIGVWLRVFLIICVAVTVSTVLSAPVAVLATVAVFIGGMSMDFLEQLAAGEAMGGGPTEAAIRLVLQENLQRDLGDDFWVVASKRIDDAFELLLRGVTQILPDLGTFNTTPHVARGFDVPMAQLLFMILAALAYAVPFSLAGYYFLQSREIAL